MATKGEYRNGDPHDTTKPKRNETSAKIKITKLIMIIRNKPTALTSEVKSKQLENRKLGISGMRDFVSFFHCITYIRIYYVSLFTLL